MRRVAFAIALGLAVSTFSAPLHAFDPGSGVFEMREPTGILPETPMRVFYHRPAAWRPDRPILIVLHGVNRDADRYLDEWRQPAEQANVLVVCPEFSNAKYPDVRWYNLGNLMDRERNGTRQPPESWTFSAVDRVFGEVRRRTNASRQGFALFGHSAGAQFVHRYLMFAERSAAEAIIVANAGWYTLPVQTVAFPYGLGGTGVGEDTVRAAFGRPVVILLGDQDIDPNHSSLRRDADSDTQGIHRFARGHFFFAAAETEARRLGVPLAWRKEIVPGVGHQNAGMARRAIEIIAPR